MKTSILVLSFFAILICIQNAQVQAGRKKLELSASNDDDDNDALNDKSDGDDISDDGNVSDDDVTTSVIEINPNYVEPELISDDDDDDDDDSEYDDDLSDYDESDDDVVETIDNNNKVKRTINLVLTSRKKTIQKLMKNRAKVTLVLAIFAFRKEILQVFLYLVKSGIVDPKTGRLRLSLTQVLKLILFVNFMRRMQQQQQQSDGGGSDNNPINSLMYFGQSNPVIGALLSKVMKFPSYNPAYVPPINQHYTFERINEKYLKDGLALHKAIHSYPEGFQWPTSDTTTTKTQVVTSTGSKELKLDNDTTNNQTVIILDMTKLGPTPSEQIRDQVSFLLSQYRQTAMLASVVDSTTTAPELEVVVILESPGGSAVDFGLAAAQLLRLRNEPGILLTICVDKVAASGGYMLACTASPGQLFAAPFSVVGSIGVLGQIININQLLEKRGITPIIFRGGKDKAPLGVIGEVTKSAKDKTQAMVDDTHVAFKNHVVNSRPVLEKNIHKVGTGDVWLGSNALDLELVDKITTSDEYIGEKVANGARVMKMVKFYRRGILFGRPQQGDPTMSFAVGSILTNVLNQAKSLIGLSHDSSAIDSSFSNGLEMQNEKLPIVASRVETPKAQI